MPKVADEVTTDDDALQQVCGGLDMVEKVRALWDEIIEKKRLDVSNQGLTDDSLTKLLKGLHMCAPAWRSLELHRGPN